MQDIRYVNQSRKGKNKLKEYSMPDNIGILDANYRTSHAIPASKWMEYACVILTIRMFLPFTMALPTIIRYGLLGIQLVCLFFALVCDKKLANSFLKTIPFFVAICIMYSWRRFEVYEIDIVDSVIAVVHFFFPIWCGLFFLKNPIKHLSEKLIRLLIICVVVTGITTIIGFSVYPEAARDLSTGMGEASYALNAKNIASFGISYALVNVIYFSIIKMKDRKSNKIWLLLFVLFMSYVVLRMQFTIAIIFLAVTFVIALVTKKSRRIVLFVLIIGLGFLIKMNNLIPTLLSTLYYFTSSHGFETVAWKIMNINNYYEGNLLYATSVNGRLDAYSISLTGFLKHPILGNALLGNLSETIGMHSEILDFMSAFGILGGIVLVGFFVAIYRKYGRVCRPLSLKNNAHMRYMFILLIMMSLLNQIIIAPEMAYAFFLLPILYLRSSIDKNLHEA